ncbi:MAG: hypothetical protein ACRDRP_17285 [Pseudonocardiaceae bacterium]
MLAVLACELTGGEVDVTVVLPGAEFVTFGLLRLAESTGFTA